MPIGVELDKTGIDITDVRLSKNEIKEIPLVKKVSKTPYSNDKNLKLDYDQTEVSLYDLPINKDFVKKVNLKFSVNQPVQSADVNQLLEFSKTHLDTYSNTSLPIVATKIAISSFNVPHPNVVPVSKVNCNDQPLNYESVNRGAVDYYNQYKLANFIPNGIEKNRGSENEIVMLERLSKAKNTYRHTTSPLVVKYKDSKISEKAYENRPKYENNKMSPFVGPKIRSHMKNHDRIYKQELKLF